MGGHGDRGAGPRGHPGGTLGGRDPAPSRREEGSRPPGEEGHEASGPRGLGAKAFPCGRKEWSLPVASGIDPWGN